MGQVSTVETTDLISTPKPCGALPDLGLGTVCFPVVGGGQAVMNGVVCNDRGTRRDGKAFVVNGVFGDEIEHVLGDGRFQETSDRLYRCVDVRFASTRFADRSFSLALAIADKIARHAGQAFEQKTIIATGDLIPDGHGKVGPVAALDRKLELIEECVGENAVIALPKASRPELTAETLARIDAIAIDRSWEVVWAEGLSDLNQIWQKSVDSPVPRRFKRLWVATAACCTIGALAFGIVVLKDWGQPTATEKISWTDTVLAVSANLEMPNAPRAIEQLSKLYESMPDQPRPEDLNAIRLVDHARRMIVESDLRILAYRYWLERGKADEAQRFQFNLTAFDRARLSRNGK